MRCMMANQVASREYCQGHHPLGMNSIPSYYVANSRHFCFVMQSLLVEAAQNAVT